MLYYNLKIGPKDLLVVETAENRQKETLQRLQVLLASISLGNLTPKRTKVKKRYGKNIVKYSYTVLKIPRRVTTTHHGYPNLS
jgi:hypothetical protein